MRSKNEIKAWGKSEEYNSCAGFFARFFFIFCCILHQFIYFCGFLGIRFAVVVFISALLFVLYASSFRFSYSPMLILFHTKYFLWMPWFCLDLKWKEHAFFLCYSMDSVYMCSSSSNNNTNLTGTYQFVLIVKEIRITKVRQNKMKFSIEYDQIAALLYHIQLGNLMISKIASLLCIIFVYISYRKSGWFVDHAKIHFNFVLSMHDNVEWIGTWARESWTTHFMLKHTNYSIPCKEHKKCVHLCVQHIMVFYDFSSVLNFTQATQNETKTITTTEKLITVALSVDRKIVIH